MAIIVSRDQAFTELGLNEKLLQMCIKKHKEGVERLENLKKYYDGDHKIHNREKKEVNNKVMVNHAEYITDFATSYFIGNPISYKTEHEELTRMFKLANIDMVDQELSRDISIFGTGYELVYQNEQGMTKSTNLSPLNCFLVVDDTVEYNSLYGVHYYAKNSLESNVTNKAFQVNVYTQNKIYNYEMVNERDLVLVDEQESVFQQVPIIEYWNKANQKGDFESVISLIDAYNVLQSDRINDKEKFVDALLVIYGTLAGDTVEEKAESARLLKKLGLLEMPNGTSAEYLSKTFNESEIEVLKQALVNDIHKISKVPNLTDENFAQNASGVAMKYKLLGLEQLAQTKEGYYRMGLKERLQLYAAVARIKMQNIDVDSVEIAFKRSLPSNELETSQLVNNLRGIVSDETLLAQIPFVNDVKAEIDRLNEQQEQTSTSFGGYEVNDQEE